MTRARVERLPGLVGRVQQQLWQHASRSSRPVRDRREGAESCGYSLQGGAVGGGVQRIGVVLYNKLVDNII